MEVIFVRSPYFIEVDEASQVESKVELFIWRKGEDEPGTIPTYTLTKQAASTTQTKNIYNISNYAKEYIDIIYPPLNNFIDEEDNNNWCYIKVKRYTAPIVGYYILLDTTTYVALNGYTNYSVGSNSSINNTEVILTSLQNNKKYKYFYPINPSNVPYINFLIGINANEYKIRLKDFNSIPEIEEINIITNPSEEYLVKLPITNTANPSFENGNTFEILKDSTVIFTATFIPECENKYEPLICEFINRFGGWDFITFFKARTQQWEVKNKEYQLLSDDVSYNTLRGESKAFNYEAKQSIKINTGWLDEYYNELIKDLMTSETILLYDYETETPSPVKLKTMSTDLKTSLQDKMINYQIEFEYNYNQINNVI